jgi:hypothetical protein
VEYLLFTIASLFGSVVAWRVLRETCLLLILALGPLLGASALVALSNARVPPAASLGLLLALLLVMAALPGRHRPIWWPMTRWQSAGLTTLALIVVVYTVYHQVHVLDGDRWLHDAQIVAFHRGIYPPVNPLFPELAMNGHFGRDLLMATLTRDGVDPAYTTWWVTPLLQLATFLTLFASVRSFSQSNGRGFLVAGFVFFGMDCGFRVGLIDTFDGSNGLAYPHLVLLFHMMNRILRGSPWPVWVVSGVVLGTYQLVYMTSFALLLVTGFALFLVKARSRQAWVGLLVTGLLAVGLAVTEGGAFTDMANRGLRPELEKAVQNQGLRVTVQFPKEHLFQVLTSTAGYHRTSVAYKTSLFEGLYEAPRGEGYMSIWDPQFMRTHWLPLYLAPLSLWLLRGSALGLSFWLFGAISYLLPGFFYFGPIFEHEYFRWEFSAAFGFAAALGLALGDWLEKSPIKLHRSTSSIAFGQGSGRYLLALGILVSSLAAGEKAVNDALIASGKDGFRWFPPMRQWRLSEPTFAMTENTLRACEWLRARTQPGQQVMTNFLNDRPMGLWPDVVAATLSGVFPAGHAYPSETEGGPHGNPAFHQNSVYRAFWASADLSLLQGTRVRWLLADTDKLDAKVVARLKAFPHQDFGDRLAVELPEPPAPAPTLGSWNLSVTPKPPGSGELRLGSRYPLPVSFSNSGEPSQAVLTLDGGLVEPLRFTVPQGESSPELSLVTPLDEGTYKAILADPSGASKASFEFTVDFLKRLEQLNCTFDFPQFKAGRFYLLEGQWRASAPLDSVGELEVAYRFKRPNGDYAWEVDSIPQALNLSLPSRPEFKLQVLTPTLPGAYDLEIWFFDRGSGRRVKMATSFPVVNES